MPGQTGGSPGQGESLSPCPQPSKGLRPTPPAAWCKASGGGDAGHLGSGLRRATGAQGHPQGSRKGAGATLAFHVPHKAQLHLYSACHYQAQGGEDWATGAHVGWRRGWKRGQAADQSVDSVPGLASR